MRSLALCLLTVLLLTACGTGYNLRPSMSMCNEPGFYSSCHWGP